MLDVKEPQIVHVRLINIVTISYELLGLLT